MPHARFTSPIGRGRPPEHWRRRAGEGLWTIKNHKPPHPNPLPDGERERAFFGGSRCNYLSLTARGGVTRNRPNKASGKPMKVRNSLKSLRGRHRNNRLVRRKGRLYVINKTNRRFKARQG